MHIQQNFNAHETTDATQQNFATDTFRLLMTNHTKKQILLMQTHRVRAHATLVPEKHVLNCYS